MNKFKYLIGAISTIPIYYLWNPLNRIIKTTSDNFDKSPIDIKFSIYESLPKIDETQIKAYIKTKESVVNNDWESNCWLIFNKIKNNMIYNFYNRMKLNLLDEINNMDNKTKLLYINKVYHNSFELKYNVQNILKKELIDNKIIDVKYLDNIYTNDNIESIDLICMKYLILTYPNKKHIFTIIQSIINDSPQDVLDLVSSENINKIIQYIKSYDKTIREKLCEELLTEIFTYIQDEDKDYIKTMFKEIINDIDEIKSYSDILYDIYINLPNKTKSKILIEFIHYKKHNSIEILTKGIIDNVGVVFVKLFQILAEDPKTPDKFVKLFEKTLCENKQDEIIDFWNNIPTPLKNNIKYFGKCVGTGSIKQVHKIIDLNDNVMVMASVKSSVLDDAIDTLNVLRNIPELNGVIDKLGDLIYSELNLYNEFKSFEQLHKIKDKLNIIIPKVNYPTPKTIMREYIDGNTINEVLNSGDLPEDKRKFIRIKLNQFHHNLLKLVFEEKLILSDVHYGNILLTEDNELSMIDPAQLTNISTNELNLLIWLLVMISSTKNINKYFNTFIEKLNLFNKIYCDSNTEELNKIKNTLYNSGNTKDRFKILLIELEKVNIKVPVSIFAFGKLYDTIMSQRNKYNFDDTIDIHLTELIKKHMTWNDIYKYFI